MSLVAWLDAGYAMLIEGADPMWRRLLEQLFSAEDDEMMERGFEALRSESDYRQAQHDKATAEQRRKTGAPTHARLLPKDDVEAALAEWEQITAGGLGASQEPVEPTV